MRDVAVTEGDKVEAQLRLGVSVNTYSVNDLVAAVDGASPAAVDDVVAQYQESYDVAPELARGGPARVAALRRPHRGGPAVVPQRGGFNAFTTNFEDLGGLRQLPGSPSSGSWPTATASAPKATGRRRCSCGS